MHKVKRFLKNKMKEIPYKDEVSKVLNRPTEFISASANNLF